MKKTMSTGFERSKLHAYASLLKYFQKNKEFAKNDYQLFLETKKIFRRHLGALSPDTRILEIGCGQRFIQTLLFTTEGATITGIDYDFISKTYSIGNICTIWKQNGFERCIKTLVRHMMYDGKYYQCIEEEYGKPLRWDKVDVRKMSACALAFPDKHFDFIFSNAVFEHIEDVEAAFAETARVLKPSGLALIRIHLYASLSGGHHLDWADPTGHPSKTVPPWDHLRKNLYPPHLYLNKLRKAEYLDIINKYFVVQDVTVATEGASLLTPEIRSEINGYSDEDLLTSSLHVLLSRTSGHSKVNKQENIGFGLE